MVDESFLIGCAVLLLAAPFVGGIAGLVIALGARKRVAALTTEVEGLRQHLGALHAYLQAAQSAAGGAAASAVDGEAATTAGGNLAGTVAVAPSPLAPAPAPATIGTASAGAAPGGPAPAPAGGAAAAPHDAASAPEVGWTAIGEARHRTAAAAAGVTVDATAPGIPAAATHAAARATEATTTAPLAADAGAATGATAPASTPPPTAPASAAATAAAPAPRTVGLEERLGTRLPIWLGAAALALAGIFLVKYSIDQDLLSPPVRVALGALFGVALLVGGELLRPRQARIAQALSAAGIADLYAVFLAATNLYRLIPPVAGFALMALNTAVAVALALRQGQLIAILGLLGGFATPALIRTGDPNARNLMAYLLLLEVGLLATARRRSWPLLSAGALLGGLAWVALFTAKALEPGDGLWLGLFLIAALGLNAWQLRDVPGRASAALAANPPSAVERFVGAASAALAVVIFAVVVGSSDYGPTEWALFGLLALGSLALARFFPDSFALAPVASLVAVILLGSWGATAIAPGEVGNFLATAAGLGGSLTAAAWLLQRGAKQPAAWASLATGNALATFLVAYVGARGVEGPDARPWGVYALVLAVVAVAAAVPLVRRRANESALPAQQIEACLGAAAVAATAFVSLAVPLFLDRAWLTVALALEVAALVWIAGRLDLALLLRLAGGVGAIVAARLLVNPAVLDYPAGPRPIVNWLLYGYGVPLLAFVVALRQAAALAAEIPTPIGAPTPGSAGAAAGTESPLPGEDPAPLRNETAAAAAAARAAAFAGLARGLAGWLRWGILAIAAALVSLEIRHLMGGGNLAGPSRNFLLEAGILALAWLGGGWLVLRRARRSTEPAWRIGGELVAWVGLAILVVGCGLIANPLWSNHPVGTLPIANLLLAIGLPAILLLAGLHRELGAREPPPLRGQLFAAAGLLTGLALVTLEVRQFFHGARLDLGTTSNAEHLTYSAAWILAGLVLLAAGIRLAARHARQAGLGVMLLAVLKVFLYDLSELDDLYRVVSFLGLGASLLLLAYLYQRFVFRHQDEP